MPDTLSEYQFAGLLRGSRTELADSGVGDAGVALQVPASAEIVLEGHIPVAAQGYVGVSEHGVRLKEIGGYLYALEGPFGDHTGYYNEQDWFPVFQIDRITHRRDPVYHSTYTGKPPDEPAVLGGGAERGLRADPAEAVSGDRGLLPAARGLQLPDGDREHPQELPGPRQAPDVRHLSFLRQFMYTKFIVVTDADVDIRDWKEGIWAITTRIDPVRDTTLVEHTPIDYLDFASPVSGLGGKMGLDATNKWPGETAREWGRAIHMDTAVTQRVEALVASIMKAGA